MPKSSSLALSVTNRDGNSRRGKSQREEKEEKRTQEREERRVVKEREAARTASAKRTVNTTDRPSNLSASRSRTIPVKRTTGESGVSPVKNREMQKNVAASLMTAKSFASLAKSMRMAKRREGGTDKVEDIAESLHANRGEKERDLQKNLDRAGPPAEEKLNRRAVEAIQRVRDKLVGCDFGEDQRLSVEDQVELVLESN